MAVNLVGALRTAGYRTTVVHRWGGPLEAELNAAADDSSTEPFRKLRAALQRWPRSKVMADRLERWSARRVLRSRRPDVVWCNTVVTWRYAAEATRLGIPTILYGHEQSEWSTERMRDALREAPSSLHLVGCSRSAADTLADLMGVDTDRVEVLHSPVDVAAVLARASAGAETSGPTVVACGTAEGRKGFDVFLAAAEMSSELGSDLRWRWVGRPPPDAGPFSRSVELAGEVADAVPYLASADVVVCPSRADSFPLVVLEAMAIGRPIVATDIPGIAEQLGPCGVLIPTGDATALLDAVDDLLANPGRAAALGHEAQQRCQDLWDVNRFDERVAELCRQALADEKAPHPLRVVHIMGRLSPGGGVQVVVRRLAEHADPTAIDLHVITMRPPWDDLSNVPLTLHPLGFDGSWSGPWTRFRVMWAAARTTRRLDADVVQVHSGMAWLGLLARFAAPRTPFVLEVHDAPGSGRHGRFTDRFEGWCIRWLGMTAVCHSTQVEHALVDVSGVPPRRIRRFPLGIDTTMFAPIDDETRQSVRRSLGVDESTVVAIAIGRPAPSKRFDLAIEAVATARADGADVSLVLVGVGDEPSLLEQRDRLDLGSTVLLLDGRHGVDLVNLIGASDILLSTSDYEGFGLTLIEGMACGLPVVAAAVGGVTDIVIDGETGYLIRPGGSDTTAHRLEALERDPALRNRLGDAGRLRARQQFDVDSIAAAFTVVYREVLR